MLPGRKRCLAGVLLAWKGGMASAPEVDFSSVEIRTRKGRILEVRACGGEDLGALVGMYRSFEPKRVAQGLPPPDVPRITRWLEGLQGKARALVVWDGAKAVAHAILCPIRAGSAEFAVFVHQEYREDGLGTALSQSALGWASRMGFLQVFLATEFSNFPALRLFRKLGFQVTSQCADECEMALDLAAARAALPRAA
jgi:GNAT superfamily N-acetyltransferase